MVLTKSHTHNLPSHIHKIEKSYGKVLHMYSNLKLQFFCFQEVLVKFDECSWDSSSSELIILKDIFSFTNCNLHYKINITAGQIGTFVWPGLGSHEFFGSVGRRITASFTWRDDLQQLKRVHVTPVSCCWSVLNKDEIVSDTNYMYWWYERTRLVCKFEKIVFRKFVQNDAKRAAMHLSGYILYIYNYEKNSTCIFRSPVTICKKLDGREENWWGKS